MARKKKEDSLLTANSDNILLEKRIDVERIKEDLTKYIDERVNETFINEIDKTNKRLLKEKSRKIFIKNIVIIVLLAIIGFLGYLLYSNNYFDQFFDRKTNQEEKDNKEQKEESSDKNEDNKKEEKPNEPTLEELIKKYGRLLDDYYINESSSYLINFYDGKLDDNLKKYFTLNSLDFDSVKKEDDYQIIDEDTFKMMYEKLFDSKYTSGSFEYNNNKIRYISMINSYMTERLLKQEKSYIIKEITDIKVENNIVTIKTIEGIVKDNKLYNILYDSEVEEYKGDALINYQDSLNKVIYIFKDNKLINLEK